MDADGSAARAAAEVSAQLADLPGDFKAALVVVDDLMGGWTNRYDCEYTFRFGGHFSAVLDKDAPAGFRLPRWTKHLWITGFLWSSEPASEKAVREAILTSVHRLAYIHRHGPASTLRDMLRQEGQVMLAAGCTGPLLDAEDLAYTREVLVPFLDATDKRTAIECLFGDAAGHTLGFTLRGLSPWAGLAVALDDARRQQSAARA